MDLTSFGFRAMLALLLFAALQVLLAEPLRAEPDDPKLANKRCLMCHGKEGFSREGPDGQPRDLSVMAQVFEHSVHGSQDCVGCHQADYDATTNPNHGAAGFSTRMCLPDSAARTAHSVRIPVGRGKYTASMSGAITITSSGSSVGSRSKKSRNADSTISISRFTP